VFEEKNKTDQIWVSQKTRIDAYVIFGLATVPVSLLGFSCYISLIDDAHPDTTFSYSEDSHFHKSIGRSRRIDFTIPIPKEGEVREQVCVIRSRINLTRE